MVHITDLPTDLLHSLIYKHIDESTQSVLCFISFFHKVIAVDKPIRHVSVSKFMQNVHDVSFFRWAHKVAGLPRNKYMHSLNSVECMKYAIAECEIYPSKHTMTLNVWKNGSVEMLRFLDETGCEWDKKDIPLIAASKGYSECLKYACEHGGILYVWLTANVARRGNLELLQYLREKGCPWRDATCSMAARNGHLECLKYAHENGCTWTRFTRVYAEKNGHTACFEYARDHGCPE